MNTSVERLEGNTVRLTVTIPAEDVDRFVDESYKRVAGKVNIHGFRKGHAPRAVIDRYVGREKVLAEAQEELLNDTYPKAVDAEDIRPIDSPDVGELDEIVEGSDYVYTAEVEVRPELELSSTEGVKVVVPPSKASDADVDAQIEQLRERFATLEPVEDRGVEAGDFVLLSFVGTVGGEPYEGNVVDKFLYEMGRGQMPAEFDQTLIGVRAGSEAHAEFPVPDTSSNPDFIGKTAAFDITVHEIKRKVLPEVDDEFAGNVGGYDTVQEMRDDIREKLDGSMMTSHIMAVEREARRGLAERLVGDVPEAMVVGRRDNMLRDFFNQLESRGISLRDYTSAVGVNPEQIQADIQEQAREGVREDLALEALFRAEGMEVTDDDVDRELSELADTAQRPIEEVRASWEESGMLAVVREQVMHRRAVRWLMDHVEVEEQAPSTAGATEAGEAGAAEEPAEAKPKRARRKKEKEES